MKSDTKLVGIWSYSLVPSVLKPDSNSIALTQCALDRDLELFSVSLAMFCI